MIRTRDLAIFLTILFMLGIGIAYTFVRDTNASSTGLAPQLVLSNDTAPYTAVNDQATINRQQNIDRLREALQNNESLVTPSPSVPSPSASETVVATSTTVVPPSGLQTCGGDDASKYIQGWPSSGVTVAENQGFRVASYSIGGDVPTIAPNGSSTTPSVVAPSKVLIEMPRAPQSLAQPHCVPSDAVGVTTSGSLILNSRAAFYRGYGQDFLIGYARDGYPIYGYYQGTVDACGGYMASDGYRYTVSSSHSYIIGCFMAEPSPFIGL